MANDNDNQATLDGALLGGLTAAAVQWVRNDNQTQRSITRNKRDARDALSQIRDLLANAETVRSYLPIVMDAQVGLAIGNPNSVVPETVPKNLPQARPDIANLLNSSLEDMKWPPSVGTYDEDNRVIKSGDMTSLFSALTFEEVRCVLLGAVQSKQPKELQKQVIYDCVNALVSVLFTLGAKAGTALSWEQFVYVWTDLFTHVSGSSGGSPTPTPTTSPHADPTQAPFLSNVNPLLASVVALGSPDIAGYAYQTYNIDTANKWRITTPGGGGVAAGTTLFTVNFKTPFTKPNPSGSNPATISYQPVISSQNPMVNAFNVTSNGFQVGNQLFLLQPNSTYDVSFTVAGCSGGC